MKYVLDTLKYLKSNLLLLPALAVAVAACLPLVDYHAIQTVFGTLTEGQNSAGYAEWLFLFMPFNCENALTVIASAAAYALLALDLAYIHTMVDKHVRFGTKSFRSVLSSLTINFAYALGCVVILLVFATVISLLLAAIMVTFTLIKASYAVAVGLVLCMLIMTALLYLVCHFYLWLPCIEITGFRFLESLAYAYAHARPRRWKIFLIVFVTIVVAAGASFAVTLYAGRLTASIVAPVLAGCAFMFLAVLSYLIYADAEGIEREDLNKLL